MSNKTVKVTEDDDDDVKIDVNKDGQEDEPSIETGLEAMRPAEAVLEEEQDEQAEKPKSSAKLQR